MEAKRKEKRNMFKHIARELFFVKQALLLRPLSKPGERQKFTTYGVVSNILSFTFAMLFISSVHMSVLMRSEREFHFYLAANALIFAFWMMVLLATVMYRYMLSFPFRKSIYVILYSVTTGFPILWIGRITGIFFEEAAQWDSFFFWAIRLFAAFYGTCFIYVNIQEIKLWGFYRTIALLLCFLLQLLLIVATEDKKEFLLLLSKF